MEHIGKNNRGCKPVSINLSQTNELRKNPLLLSMKSWLVNKDSDNGLL